MTDTHKSQTQVERTSDRELVVTRLINGPAHLVFKAWASPDLFQRWWIPKSVDMAFVSCDMDVRTGGAYRLVFRHPAFEEPMAFFGKYLDVVPSQRIVWTNEEGGEGGPVTTVTFEEANGQTRVTLRDLYPDKASLDAAISSGSTGGYDEQFGQLDALLADLE
jgi:uncharacterized protein YndB with AHSA1/START domain